MAAHLVRAGHEIAVSNRTASRSERFVSEHRARKATSAADAADGASFVFVCVGGDDDVREVVAGARGVLGTLDRGAIVVDHTTTSAVLAREMAERASECGVTYLDAPVSGGQAGAERGVLTVMAGGDEAAFERVAPILLSSYARHAKHLGSSGSGQLAKMVNQICIAGLVEALAEGVAFAEAAGLDVSAVIDVISKGAAQSWQMENRAATMIEGRFDFGFAVDWMRKDLGIAIEEARRNGAALPVTALVDQLYAELQKMGAGRLDTSSLLVRLRRNRDGRAR